jgi:hypothetical protein
MAQAGNGTWRDRIRRAFQSRDEGELENAINDLPDHAELHLHIPSKEKKEEGGEMPPTDNVGPGITPAMDSRLKAHDSELEEIWRALAGNKSRDAFSARNARRKRMGIGDQEKEDEDEDDKKKNNDAFRDPPDAGGDGNRKILPGFEMEAPPGTADAHKKARDSAFMSDAYQQTCAYAEILVPGIQMPTFDSALPPQKTFDALCGFRAKVIDLAWTNPETRTLIEDMTGGQFTGDIKTWDCARVRDLFIAVGAAKARENSANNRRSAMPAVPDGASYPVGAATLADVQKGNAEFWKNQRH